MNTTGNQTIVSAIIVRATEELFAAYRSESVV